jgi:hypothetical protein
VAELAWLSGKRPDACPVTPLWLGEQPAVALPYAYEHFARAVALSDAAGVVLSDQRMSGSNWQPLVLTGRPRLIEDKTGDLFAEHLLTQELRKYPPARALIDSPLLQKENWWYVPRLVIVVEAASATTVGARPNGTGQVVAISPVADHTSGAAPHRKLVIDTVRVDDQPTHEDLGGVRLSSLTGRTLPDGTAALLGHDFSVPDLERWTPWVSRGQLRDGILQVEERPAHSTLEPPLRLRDRLRRHRALEKACRRALGP